MRKPRLFIASSVESLSIAEAVNVNFDHDLEVTIWKNGTFKISSTAIDDLVEKSSSVDFALFIFAPDDIATLKKKEERIVRDNVLFEMGLFIGAIGKERSFILKPRGIEMHLPTDLLGTTPADYESGRSDGDLASATNRACSLIKMEVDRLGLMTISEPKRLRANSVSYDINDIDLRFLAFCLQSHTCCPEGLSFNNISHGLGSVTEELKQVAAIKLERMGCLAKSIAVDDQDGYNYYSYTTTELGIDTVLKHEDRLLRIRECDDHAPSVPF